MQHKLFETTIVFIFILFTVHFAVAADFAQRSAIITNSYFPMIVGDRIIKVHDEINDKRDYKYEDAIKIEIVDGVNCLRVTRVDTFNSWFTSFCIAQDISGNVYLLKYYDTENSTPIILGKDNPFLLFPNVIQVGDVINGGETVIEIGVSVGQLSTGLGPYTSCIKAVEDDGDFVYYAPNVGSVKKESVANDRTWELKEVIHKKSKTVIIPLF